MMPSNHPRRRLLGVSILLACAVPLALIGGCGVVKKDKRAVTLQNATNGYQAALRWGYYENAYGFVAPEIRDKTPTPPVKPGLHLTGYDVVQPPVMLDADKATQIVAIEYLYEDRQVVKRLTDRQLWHWDEEKKTWWLMTGLPTFE